MIAETWSFYSTTSTQHHHPSKPICLSMEQTDQHVQYYLDIHRYQPPDKSQSLFQLQNVSITNCGINSEIIGPRFGDKELINTAAIDSVTNTIKNSICLNGLVALIQYTCMPVDMIYKSHVNLIACWCFSRLKVSGVRIWGSHVLVYYFGEAIWPG